MGHSSQVRGKSACADRHCSQSKWPSARIADIDIGTWCTSFSISALFSVSVFLAPCVQSRPLRQGGRRELKNEWCLRSRRPGRASYCTRGRGKFGNREKRSVLENSFCSFFRTPDSCQEAPPPPLLLFPFFPLSFPSLCIFFFFPQFSAKLVFQKI